MWMLADLDLLQKHVVSRSSACLRRFVSGAAEASAPTRAALVGLGYPDVHVAYFADHGRIPGSVSAAAADVRGDHLALGCGSDGDGPVFFRPLRIPQQPAGEPGRDAVPALSPTLSCGAGHSAHPARKLEPGRAFLARGNLADHAGLVGGWIPGANCDAAGHGWMFPRTFC